jgi:hypothetical protein
LVRITVFTARLGAISTVTEAEAALAAEALLPSSIGWVEKGRVGELSLGVVVVASKAELLVSV